MFWDMNPARLRPYQKAEEIRQQKENYMLWLNGMYTLEALQSALSGLSGKKSKIKPYLKEPIPITKGDIEEVERKKQERMKQQFENFVEGLKQRERFNQDSKTEI